MPNHWQALQSRAFTKNPTRKAISYLVQNIEQGIVTPLAYAHRDAILHHVGAVDLTEADKNHLRSAHRV
jgi:hypothetical protein